MQPKGYIILVFLVTVFTVFGCSRQTRRYFASIDVVLESNSHYSEYELLETYGNAKPPFYRSSAGDVVLNEGANKKACRYTEHGVSHRVDLSKYNQAILLSFLKDPSDNTLVLVLGRTSKIKN